jgi:hypothetical protein
MTMTQLPNIEGIDQCISEWTGSENGFRWALDMQKFSDYICNYTREGLNGRLGSILENIKEKLQALSKLVCPRGKMLLLRNVEFSDGGGIFFTLTSNW